MKKASLLVLLLICASFTAITVLTEAARATTLYVGGAGAENYTSIQDAIDDASAGDTVYVYRGTYYEHVEIRKTISLVGEDRDATIVDASGARDAIRVTASWVNVTGFTARNSGPWFHAAVELEFAANCQIANNRLVSSYAGISLDRTAYNAIVDNRISNNSHYGIRLNFSRWDMVSGNMIFDNKWGIKIIYSEENEVLNNVAWNNEVGISLSDSDGNTIANNSFSSSILGGITVSVSDGNMIMNNTVFNNDHGIYLGYSEGNTLTTNRIEGNERGGISIRQKGDNNLVLLNEISSNGGHGIFLESSTGNLIDGNIISSNDGDGVHLESSDDNTITNNSIRQNGGKGLRLESSHGNIIQDNSLEGNWGDTFGFLKEAWFWTAVAVVTALVVATSILVWRRKRKEPEE